jgi:hypothetical protein
MNVLLQQIFDRLHVHQIAYCVLRDGHALETIEARNAELDLLVSPNDFHHFDRAIRELGFTPFARLGSAPHVHFVKRLDDGAKFELDVVTRIAYGVPVRNLETDLAQHCIENRRLVNGVYIPSPEDEIFTVLLHCLLDKGRIAPHRAARIQALREQVTDTAHMSRLCAQYWSAKITWSDIDAMIAAGDWSSLLAQRKSVASHIMRQDVLGTWTRAIGKRALRKLDSVARMTRSTLSSKA